MANPINVLGICGREGAGKTTIANGLTGSSPEYELRITTNPLDFICEVIFGETDTIWEISPEGQRSLMRRLIRDYVDVDWFAKHPDGKTYQVPYETVPNGSTWREFSFATPLKRICSLIYDVPYDVLLAQTPETRISRETFVCVGGHNGRTCLEYFGTNVLRKLFDEDIFLKILQREALACIASGCRVVIPDVRFENEINLINNLSGTLLVVSRNASELNITDADRKTHPAKWHFLQYYRNAKKFICFLNYGSIDVLNARVKELVL